jgi:AbrB family looped-hinge helix DNA binding protein
MEMITVSSKGRIAIPKHVRKALNLSEDSKLTLEVRGQERSCFRKKQPGKSYKVPVAT